MPARLSADVNVENFGLESGDNGIRLEFPVSTIGPMVGTAGAVSWTISGGTFQGLSARLRSGQWQATSGKIQGLTLRGPDDAVVLEIAELDLPDGVMLSPSIHGVELNAPTAMLRSIKVANRGGVEVPDTPIKVEVTDPTAAPVVKSELRQTELTFLDGLAGELRLTVKVQLDLPVVGVRTLDQKLRIPIEKGSLNFRELDKSLDWLEGTFLDIDVRDGRLMIRWRVPILGSHEIISWALDPAAKNLAAFDRVPVRSLADFRIAGGKKDGKGDGKRGRLRSLSVENIEVKLSMNAPRSVAIGDGHVLFGGEDSPGLVDLKVTGQVGDGDRPGSLRGSIGELDLTVADLALGDGTQVSIDRVRLGQIDPVELRLVGFGAAGINATIAEIAATNLKLRLGNTAKPTPGPTGGTPPGGTPTSATTTGKMTIPERDEP